MLRLPSWYERQAQQGRNQTPDQERKTCVKTHIGSPESLCYTRLSGERSALKRIPLRREPSRAEQCSLTSSRRNAAFILNYSGWSRVMQDVFRKPPHQASSAPL